MYSFLVCPSGHRWEVTVDSAAGSAPAPMVCPLCGQPCAPAQPPSTSRDTSAPSIALSPTLVSDRPRETDRQEAPFIPGYEIVMLLGRGGMGVVYKARHERLNRLVALKLILSGAHASPHQMARFQIEAEALASLQHPNIVQLYEVGDYDGRQYLSLELVEGGSLADRLAGKPIPAEEAARRVETLARAVHAAHLRGIVHRDLKPANVLLGADGSLKVTDFGLAKRFDEDSQHTQVGAILGTPSYMAPEQTLGDPKAVGPLADVYALGVILYEMLTGRPPFRAATSIETIDQVRTKEPVPPRRLVSRVPRDLEVVCLKCLEKEPSRRYGSAEALADDLRRFLALEPIKARPAGVRRRLVKWARRRPALAALVAVSVTAVVGFVVFALLSNVALRAQRDLAEKNARKAEKNFRKAREYVDEMYTRVAQEWLEDEPRKDRLQREFLEKALEAYKEFAEEEGDDPEIRRKAAQAQFRTGQIYRTLGERDRAEAAYRAAIEQQARHCEEDPADLQSAHDLATSYNWLGELYREKGGDSLKKAEEYYREALAIQERLLQASPDEPAYRKDRARSQYNLAIVEMDTGRMDEAGRRLDDAVAVLQELHGKHPTNTDYRQELARCSLNRGYLRSHKGDEAGAEEDYRRAVTLLRALREEAPGRVVYKFDLAVSHRNLGNLLSRKKEYEGARREIDASIELLAGLARDFPGQPRYRKKLAEAWNSSASVQARVGSYKDVQVCWEKARALLEQLVKEHYTTDHDIQLGIVTANLGWLATEQKDPDRARSLLHAGVKRLEGVRAKNSGNLDAGKGLRDALGTLAELEVRCGNHTAAAAAARSLATFADGKAQFKYNAACFLARAILAAEKDTALTESDRVKVSRSYAQDALKYLAEVFAGKSAGVQRLEDEQAIFRPLEAYPEFGIIPPKAG